MPSPERGFSLPTGTVTFLLTDVEGSSRRWEDAPDAMAEAVSRHYVLLDERIARHGGVRPVEQGEGDSVVAAFSRASDAVAAALDAQRALTAEHWPAGADIHVRMAIHTGEALMRDSGNYFGQSVIRCARLRAIGHGDQVLLSDVSAALVAGRLPDGAELVDLGVHRLKDLGRPERVWQLVGPGLGSEFPPLRSIDAFRHNLPIQVTPLIGRSQETAEVGRRLAEERLVTLTGSGGVGKTRLALAVAVEALEHLPGGVWLVELAGVAHADGVAAAALAVLGAFQTPGVALVDQVAAAFGAGSALLVLDNCEHLIDACADFVAALLAAAPAVQVLATSREPLSVPGEISWRVPSLNAPPAETSEPVAVLSQYDAVRLFIDRARRARPSFAVTEDNAPAIAQICHRLDGIPLALELAAARCRQLSAERIAHDLDDRFRLLTGGARTVLPRQQTLAASIDWSYDRLDATEQITLRRLGVFNGPFPLEAGEWLVASFGDSDRVGVFDTISRLVDKSLVVVEEGSGGEPRYRLLETLRAYALTRVKNVGELDELRRNHATWWLSWLEERFSVLHTDPILEEIDQFHHNLKAALDWSLDEPAIGLRLLRYLCRPWQNSGRPREVLGAVDRLLVEEHAQIDGPMWVLAACSSAVLMLVARGVPAVVELLASARRVATLIDDEYGLAVVHWLQGYSDETCTRLRDMARTRGDRYVAACATIALAETHVAADPTSALGELQSADFLAASRESSYLADWATRTRAFAHMALGNLDECIGEARRLTETRSTLMASNAVYILSAAALLTAEEEQLIFAAGVGERRLRATAGTAVNAEVAANRLTQLRGGPAAVDPEFRPDNNEWSLPSSLYLAAREALDAGQAELALETVRAQTRPTPVGQAVLAAIEGTLSGSEDCWHDALQIAGEHRLRLIVVDALEGLATAASGSESWAECLRLFAAAERLRDECRYQWRFRHQRQTVSDAISQARSHLDPAKAAAAESEGRELEWPEAIRYARRARGQRKRPRHGWDSLTPTEWQVVGLVGEGLTNPQIAERLIMGRSTVKTHLDHIFAKLGVTSRAEVAAQAARRAT
jgi:predicted ATPase/class 3 adenylate cyclase/DNA-binding NarL/FixJ family response regulator